MAAGGTPVAAGAGTVVMATMAEGGAIEPHPAKWADIPEVTPPPPPSPQLAATGSFVSDPIGRLATFLAKPDAASRRAAILGEVAGEAARVAGGGRAATEFAEDFASAFERSASACRRAALLYGGAGDLAISFNGGKDACVVLYLFLACVAAACNGCSCSEAQDAASPNRTGHTVIFFDSDSEFPAVRDFVAWVVHSLGLRMLAVASSNFKQGMTDLVSSGLRAVVMGQRRGDPWTDDVDLFSPSTEGWPTFMRINPIIQWSYSQVWLFLRAFGLPYCSMYDEGYTSIGSIADTQKNPALLRPDGSHAPAFELPDGTTERAGRANGGSPSTAKKAASGFSAAFEAEDTSPFFARTISASPCLRAFRGSTKPRTAGIAVVGNEILTGRVHDANAHYLCGELHRRGVVVKYIEVVPDDVDAIARCVKRMASRCDDVFTSGGIGPTHDDKTMDGVALAFEQDLVEDQHFYAVLASGAGRRHRGSDACDDACVNSSMPSSPPSEAAYRKMASVPRGARLEWPEDGNPWPIVSMRNVHILAGPPPTFRAMFERAARDGRFKGSRRWRGSSLWLDAEEEDIAMALRGVADAFPQVELGSYVAANAEGRRRLNVVLEAFEAEALDAARRQLEASLPEGMLVAEEPLPFDDDDEDARVPDFQLDP